MKPRTLLALPFVLAALVLPKLVHLLHVEPVVYEAEEAHAHPVPTHALPA